MMLDCAIIGGGPAGLSAALVLGRARRKVLLFDADRPRNSVSSASHGFLSRDGIEPAMLKSIAQKDLLQYPSVAIKQTEVVHVKKNDKHFVIVAMDKGVYLAKKVILATGIKEVLPNLTGLKSFYGKSVFSCAYCDGWELRDKQLAIFSGHPGTLQLIKILSNWSKNLIVCTNGNKPLDEETKVSLQSKGIKVYEEKIAKLFGDNGQIKIVHFENGLEAQIEGGFVSPEWCHPGSLAKGLGCKQTEKGGMITDSMGRTNIIGVYAAGDNTIVSPSQIAIAAGDGSRTAIGVNIDLTNEEFIL
ncbi:NAD(P)/FAD-dependent oxidoreductase [Cytobacillus purgationiresistens]|uniref:Thioredoxin reductase n=1 Tax=Cytobacillus purgationiresistens TaxID=863449 RepID=A0ABU0AK48_9BACI|nr:NAD(P)/FAD-dependent oxidoreductase [Cytobacillus purgationiresistens]MDQ0271644.1 thioredoxin reductase [Cytobacillus purgationiresistens]